MQFPALMPKELDSYLTTSKEEALYVALEKKPRDFILFFETASDDETWTENHEAFMKKVLEWLTEQTTNDRFTKREYERVAFAIQKHYPVLKALLPINLLIKLKDGDVPFNSLLLTAASDFFKQILLKESLEEENKNVISFPYLTKTEFIPIESFITTREVIGLETKGDQEIVELIKRATAWDLPFLSKISEMTLSKYLDVENIFDMLALAKNQRWGYFEEACIEFINLRNWGYKLSGAFERLNFEFLDFSEPTLAFFAKLKPLITDIVCSGELCQQPEFGKILKGFPVLQGLDISRTLTYSEQFEEIPKNLERLNLSESPWVTKVTIKQIQEFCPGINQLLLKNNVHLNYIFFGELIKFKALKKLDLSGCTQLQDSDLNIVLKGFSSLRDLSLNNCKKIGEKGFLDVAKTLSRAVHLNLSRCSLSDTALIEIITRCRYLTALDISSCLELTDKGVLALTKYSQALLDLNLSRCRISVSTVNELKRIFPQLNLII